MRSFSHVTTGSGGQEMEMAGLGWNWLGTEGTHRSGEEGSHWSGAEGTQHLGAEGILQPTQLQAPACAGMPPLEQDAHLQTQRNGHKRLAGHCPFRGVFACVCGGCSPVFALFCRPLTPILLSPAFFSRSGSAGLQQRGSEHRLCPACSSPGAGLVDEALLQTPEQC